MKKKMYVLMITAMMVGLAACGKPANQPSDEANVTIEEAQNGDESNNVANPWASSNQQGILDATGINMEAPEGATNMNYSLMADEKMAELTYEFEGAQWVYRTQPTEALTDISGMNYEWISKDTGKVADLEAEYFGYSEQEEGSDSLDNMFVVQVVNWYDAAAGITYSLSASGKNLNGMDIQVYAENLYSVIKN